VLVARDIIGESVVYAPIAIAPSDQQGKMKHRVSFQLVQSWGSGHVPKPVDTTGAGDSFNGAYIASRFEGKTGQESAHIAHRIAAQLIMTKRALVEMSKLRTNLGPMHMAQLKPQEVHT
jgi:pyridoxal/pyridoxine/pyridoxamine kinase